MHFRGDKHSEVRWMEEHEVEGFSEQAVPDFKNTLRLVFDRLKETKNE